MFKINYFLHNYMGIYNFIEECEKILNQFKN